MEHVLGAVLWPCPPQFNAQHAPLSRHCSVTKYDPESSSYTPHPFPIRDMTDRPRSDRFHVLLESALQECEKKSGVILVDKGDSLAIQLHLCHSIDDITTLLQDKTRAFSDFQHHDRILKSIKATVSVLSPVSAVTTIAEDAGLVRQKVMKTRLAFLIIFTDITPTCESDIFYSRYPTGCMYRS